MESETGTNTMGWWVMKGEVLLEMLKRAAGGEDPEMLVTELYANAEQEDYSE